MKQHLCTAAAACGVASSLLAGVLSARAHEHREVAGGKYEMVVGFMEEPAFAGLKNGLSLRVSDLSSATPTAGGEKEGAPVVGLNDTLKAEVILGDQKMDLPLEPAWGKPGAYESVFFPMKPGDYTFHVTGAIEGTAVDETFTAGPDTFSTVEDPAPYQFPKGEASVGLGTVAAVTSTVGDTSSPSRGRLAAAGLLAGVVGVAGTAGLRRRSVGTGS